ncbi:SCP-like protein [Ancylostoma duodenale]|uniref:SCP-like protein n=1 Tax=Ancylostoma duodenale TaxID=51022 RepID=A0A0C2D413_9BILA|nr:SCP-like protein [Ancylostoma duodenale]
MGLQFGAQCMVVHLRCERGCSCNVPDNGQSVSHFRCEEQNREALLYSTLGRGKNCNITEKTNSVLKKWWNEAVTQDLSANPKYDPAIIKNFGRMASGEVKGFACTYNSCGTSGDTELLCAYSAKVADNTALYTPTNTDTEICNACPQNKCVFYLCKDAYTPVADAEPKSRCPNNEDGMTYDMQTIALSAHNYYRRLTATGWAQDSKGYAPTSKKMETLNYDCTNAGAESKTQAHDCTKIGQYTAKAGYSLNYATFDYTVSEQDALEQMVLGESTQIGCATKNCQAQGKTVVVCQYDK